MGSDNDASLADGIGRAGDDVTVEDDEVGTLADRDTAFLVCVVRRVRGSKWCRGRALRPS